MVLSLCNAKSKAKKKKRPSAVYAKLGTSLSRNTAVQFFYADSRGLPDDVGFALKK
jgi:hypothetical protein